jgi:hypothetical protein
MHEQWAWIIIHAHCSCSRGLRPRYFFLAGSGPVPKTFKKYIFRKICDFPAYFLLNFS